MVKKLRKECKQTIKDQPSLEDTDDKFRIMANCTPVLIWISNKEPTCAFVNQSWLDFTGRSLEEELGHGWTKSIHPDDFPSLMDFCIKAHEQRKPFEVEYRLKRADGEYRWILDKAVPYYDKNNNYQGFIGSCIDITSKKQLESYRTLEIQRLKLLNSKLKNMNEQLEDFSNMVAHDLKTSLRHLFMYAELLKKDLDVDIISQNSRHALKMMENVAISARDLIDNLWALATLGSFSLTFEKANLDTVVRQSLECFVSELDKIKAEVIINPLPVVSCCPNLIAQVFQNLVQNAIKFRQKDHKLQITIGAEEQAGFWRFYVKDNGRGIESGFFKDIFKMHKRLSPDNCVQEGAGIGLSICKKIIKQHGGEIEVSSPGNHKGSIFYFTLPRN